MPEYHVSRYRRTIVALLLGVSVITVLIVAHDAQWQVTGGERPPPAHTGEPSAVSSRWYRPSTTVTWRWQLSGVVDPATTYDLHNLDLYDTPVSTLAAIRARGEHSVCYLSAGSWEEWRPDAAAFPAVVLGQALDGWPGERWLDIRRLDLLAQLMNARLDLCKAKGFEAVEPDNVDGYTNTTGFPLTYADQIAYNRWLAEQAHARGLGIALKNSAEQVDDLAEIFDFAIVEECFTYDECRRYTPFVARGKAVLAVEYTVETTAFCAQAQQLNFRAMQKRRGLDAWALPCWP